MLPDLLQGEMKAKRLEGEKNETLFPASGNGSSYQWGIKSQKEKRINKIRPSSQYVDRRGYIDLESIESEVREINTLARFDVGA